MLPASRDNQSINQSSQQILWVIYSYTHMYKILYAARFFSHKTFSSQQILWVLGIILIASQAPRFLTNLQVCWALSVCKHGNPHKHWISSQLILWYLYIYKFITCRLSSSTRTLILINEPPTHSRLLEWGSLKIIINSHHYCHSLSFLQTTHLGKGNISAHWSLCLRLTYIDNKWWCGKRGIEREGGGKESDNT